MAMCVCGEEAVNETGVMHDGQNIPCRQKEEGVPFMRAYQGARGTDRTHGWTKQGGVKRDHGSAHRLLPLLLLPHSRTFLAVHKICLFQLVRSYFTRRSPPPLRLLR